MPFSLLQPLSELPLVAIDVETTGIGPERGDRIIELAMVRIERGQITAEYQQLLDPRRRIGARISALTGITQNMVSGQPTFADELDRMEPLLSGAVILGHNVAFDLAFLRAEFRRCGRELFGDWMNAIAIVDTLRLARRRFGRGGNGLGQLARRLGVGAVAAHRALGDAHTTRMVFQRLLEPYGGWRISLCDLLILQGPAMRLPQWRLRLSDGNAPQAEPLNMVM